MNIYYAAPPPFNGRTEDKPPPPRSPLINGVSAPPVTPQRPVNESPHINGISANPVTPERPVYEAAFSTPHTTQASRILFNEISADPQGSGATSDELFSSVSPVRRLVYPDTHYNNNGFRIDSLRLDNDTTIIATFPVFDFKRDFENVGSKKQSVHRFLSSNCFSLVSEEVTECKYETEEHLSQDDLDQIIKGIIDILDISTRKLDFTFK